MPTADIKLLCLMWNSKQYGAKCCFSIYFSYGSSSVCGRSYLPFVDKGSLIIMLIVYFLRCFVFKQPDLTWSAYPTVAIRGLGRLFLQPWQFLLFTRQWTHRPVIVINYYSTGIGQWAVYSWQIKTH